MEHHDCKASVIVPVYQAKPYLEKCILSLLCQDMEQEQMEILLVDDGSTDGSGELCASYASMYSCIRFLSQSHAGASAARNQGIREARGAYILFVDADDFVSENYVRSMTSFLEEHGEDVDLVASHETVLVGGKTQQEHIRYRSLTETGLYDLEVVPYALQEHINICVRKEAGLQFEEGRELLEGLGFCAGKLSGKGRIGYVKEADYCFCRNLHALGARLAGPVHTFEPAISLFEELFRPYEGKVPAYLQALFLYDFAEKFRQGCYWPYHYRKEALAEAKGRFHQLMQRVDNDIIQSYPDTQSFERMYWLRLKGAMVEADISVNGVRLYSEEKLLYSRNNFEIILVRIRASRGTVFLRGFVKSPLFAFGYVPKLYGRTNGEEQEIPCKDCGAGYYRAKEKTNAFFGFEMVLPVKDTVSVQFSVGCEGVRLPASFYNSGTVPLSGGNLSFLAGDIYITEKPGELVFQKIEGEELEQRLSEELQKIKDPALRRIAETAASSRGRRIWLYMDSLEGAGGNGWAQFLHDAEKEDGIERYYIADTRKPADPGIEEGRIVLYGSEGHLELFLQAEKILASFIEPTVLWPTTRERKQLYAFFHGEVIWLQHGVWHAHLPWQYSKYLSMADRVVVSSSREKKNFLCVYDYGERDLLLSGLPRFDGLERGRCHAGRILYAPSWRSYLLPQEQGLFEEEISREVFLASDYAKGILALVQHPGLQSFLEERGMTLEVRLHPRFSGFREALEGMGNRVVVAEKDADLNRYDMLVTDYSSILHDFAYMGKPVVSFLPDRDEFTSGRNHYRELEISLSDWCCCAKDAGEAADAIIRTASRDFVPEDRHQKTFRAAYEGLEHTREHLYQALYEKMEISSEGRPAISMEEASLEEHAQENFVEGDSFEEFKARFSGFDKEHVWMFDAGHQGRRDFRGNPKYLFVYVNRYRPDICAYWYCTEDAEATIEQVRFLGFCCVVEGTPEAEYALGRTGVIVTEMLREYTPDAFLDKKYINLWHGVGFKRIERALSLAVTGDLRLAMARKYIRLNSYYMDHQLLVATSPIFEKEYMEDCALDHDHILRTGYLRCMYQQTYEPIHTFDADLLGQKGLPSDTVLAVYAPTYRAKRGNAFVRGMENFEELHACCKRNHILLVFKVHPFIEKETGFLHAWQMYRDYPYFWFWDNRDDFYEIIDRMDLVIYDYSGMFSDFLCAGVKHYIRYIYDEEEYMAEGFTQGREAYEERTCGIKCHTFEELLHAIDHYKDFQDEHELQTIYQRLWAYAGPDDFEKTVQSVLDFRITKKEYPTLYSFDVFDTLLSRRGLHPYSIFYAVRERMSRSQGFSADFIERYPRLRHSAEMNVREYYRRTTMNRNSEKTEIRMGEIFRRLQEVYELTDAQAKLLMDWEIEEELAAVVPLTEQIDLLKKYHGEGNQVVLISDMYLPKQVVQRILGKADPLLAGLPLFLSSEYGVLKTTKWLYFEVYRSFRPCYSFGRWIHYGDTPNADQAPAKWMGIQPCLVPKPSFGEMETALVNSLHNSDGYLFAAMQARLRQEYPGTREEFVIDFVGLSMIPYVDWVLRDAMAKGFRTLYFVSRDGYFLKKIADGLIAGHRWAIKTKYIYASRRTWRIPSYFDKIDDCFWLPQGGSFNDIRSKENLFRAMDLDEDTFHRIYPYVDLEQVDWNESQPGWTLAPLLEPSEEYREYLLAKAAEERPMVCDYLRQELDPEEKFAMVEYWGRGYNQECMSRLWNHVLGKEVPCYYYYARTLYPTEGDCIRYNFTSSDVSLEFMESIFANMPYRTIESYEKSGGRIEPVILPMQHDKALFDVMEQLLPEMARRYASLGLKDPEGTNRQLYDFLLWYFWNNKQSPLLAQNLGRLKDTQSVAGQKREYAPAYTMEDIEGFRAGVPRGRRTSSVTMSYLRAGKAVRDAYDDLYQREPGDNLADGSKLSDGEIQSNRDYRRKCEKLETRALNAEIAYDHYCRKVQVSDQVCVVAGEVEFQGEVLRELVRLLRDEGSLSVLWIPANRPEAQDGEMMRQLAAARCIILRRNVEQLSGLRFRPETCVIRLLDRGFRLFRFGHLFLQKLRWRVRYEKMIASVQATAIEHTGADTEILGYNLNREIAEKLPGACITDILFDEGYRQESLEKVHGLLPEAEKKKLIFYMPTPRMREKSKEWLELLDLERLAELLGEDYVLAVDFRSDRKAAEQGKNPIEIPGFSMDVTKLDVSPRNLMLAADVILGDYRDTFFESALLHKPVFSTAYDARRIQETHPNLLYDLSAMYPFPIVRNADELAERLGHLEDYDYRPLEEFNRKYLQGCDGKASQRMVEYVKEVCGKKQDRRD